MVREVWPIDRHNSFPHRRICSSSVCEGRVSVVPRFSRCSRIFSTSSRPHFENSTIRQPPTVQHSSLTWIGASRTDVALELNTLQNSGVLSFTPMLVILAFEALIWTPMKSHELSEVKEDQLQSEQLRASTCWWAFQYLAWSFWKFITCLEFCLCPFSSVFPKSFITWPGLLGTMRFVVVAEGNREKWREGGAGVQWLWVGGWDKRQWSECGGQQWIIPTVPQRVPCHR